MATAQQNEADLLLRDVPQQSDPVEAADQAVQAAQRRHKHAAHLTEVFDAELVKAREELVFRASQVTDAVAAVVRTSPQLRQLLDGLALLRRDCRSIEAILQVVDSHNALPANAKVRRVTCWQRT